MYVIYSFEAGLYVRTPFSSKHQGFDSEHPSRAPKHHTPQSTGEDDDRTRGHALVKREICTCAYSRISQWSGQVTVGTTLETNVCEDKEELGNVSG